MQMMDIQEQIRKSQGQIQENQEQIRENQIQIKKMQSQIMELSERVDEIFDQQFVFEHEYGTKIDAILDAVTMGLDTNKKQSKEIHELNSRVDNNEISIFGLEQKVSTLELKQG